MSPLSRPASKYQLPPPASAKASTTGMATAPRLRRWVEAITTSGAGVGVRVGTPGGVLTAAAENTTASPWSLGADYFGRFAGPADLSEPYREARGSVWDEVAAGKSTRRTKLNP